MKLIHIISQHIFNSFNQFEVEKETIFGEKLSRNLSADIVLGKREGKVTDHRVRSKN